MNTYTFEQTRQVITEEKTTIEIVADSYEEALEKAEELTPFRESAEALDDLCKYVNVEVDEDGVTELSPEDNSGEATVITYFNGKPVFDNKPKQETNDLRIKRLLGEGPLAGVYLCMGMNSLLREIESLSDDEVLKMFMGLIHPQTARKNIGYMHSQLFPEISQKKED